MIGSAGEFGLLFAFFANRDGGNGDKQTSLNISDLEATMAQLQLPDSWKFWRKEAVDWVHATARIPLFCDQGSKKGLRVAFAEIGPYFPEVTKSRRGFQGGPQTRINGRW
ncbi:MAG: hypothetical protein ACM3TN_21515 [Alphaproteobacteria bacterium]